LRMRDWKLEAVEAGGLLNSKQLVLPEGEVRAQLST
jgi:hypothetical protein